jgi:AAA+ superfamily predicted ATPase
MTRKPLRVKFLDLLLARSPLVYVDSSEWERVQGALQSAITDESKETNKPRRLLVKMSAIRAKPEVWDVGEQRWVRDHESIKEVAKFAEWQQHIRWFRDQCPHPVCLLLDDMQGKNSALGDTQDKLVMATLRDFVRVKKDTSNPVNQRKTIVVASEGWNYPPEIRHELVTLEMDLPDINILNTTLRITCEDFSVPLPKGEMKNVILKSALGLTVMEAEQAFSSAIIDSEGEWNDSSSKVVLKRKRDIIRQSGALDYLEADQKLDSIGGLDLLKEWLNSRANLFSPAARERGISQPKGILLTGVPGCGKSLTAKVIGNEWGLPIVRFDIGSVFQGTVGSSERNIRDALKLAEAVSPCVLFIDEIEKGLAGSGGSGNLDSGTGMRVFGTILSWMSDQNSGTFVVATANNLSNLPAELKRKGRFDDIFYVGLPDDTSREEIFIIKLNEKEPSWRESDLDMDTLVSKTKKWTGAEIEAAVNDALVNAFNDGNRAIKMDDIMQFINKTTPQADSLKDDIDKMMKEADLIGRRASSNRDKSQNKNRGNRYD